MSLTRKISFTIVFLSALVSVGGAITRMVGTLEVVTTGTSGVADPRLEVTRVAFWGMLEGGLALIAVNMPSLWSLGRRISPEAILRSVRSVISLRTLDSKTGKLTVDVAAATDSNKPSISSESGLFNRNRKEAKFETYAMRDVDVERQAEHSKAITVHHDFSKAIMGPEC